MTEKIDSNKCKLEEIISKGDIDIETLKSMQSPSDNTIINIPNEKATQDKDQGINR